MDRLKYWENIVNANNFKSCLEVGVHKGEFSAHLLRYCPSIESYILIDPWIELSDWNKPLNNKDIIQSYHDTIEAISFAIDKVVILRGTNLEVHESVENESCDFIYIDGDHTLRGITIDLILSWNKLRMGGCMGGDDCTGIFQHGIKYEPTMIMPFIRGFAEAMDCPLIIEGGQFQMWKIKGHYINDKDGNYFPNLKTHLSLKNILKEHIKYLVRVLLLRNKP